MRRHHAELEGRCRTLWRRRTWYAIMRRGYARAHDLKQLTLLNIRVVMFSPAACRASRRCMPLVAAALFDAETDAAASDAQRVVRVSCKGGPPVPA